MYSNIYKNNARDIHCAISFFNYAKVFLKLVNLYEDKQEISYQFIELRSIILIWLLKRTIQCVPVALIEHFIKVFNKLYEQLSHTMKTLLSQKHIENMRYDFPENMEFLGTKLCQLSVTKSISSDYIEHCKEQLESFFWEIYGDEKYDLKSHIGLCTMQLDLIQSYINCLMQPHEESEDLYFTDIRKKHSSPPKLRIIRALEEPERNKKMKVINTDKDLANYIKGIILQLDYEKIYDKFENIRAEQIEYSYKFVMFRAMILIWLMNRISFCVPNIFLNSYIEIIIELKDELDSVLTKLNGKTTLNLNELVVPEYLNQLYQQIQDLTDNSPVDIALLDRCQTEIETAFWKRFEVNTTNSSPIYCSLMLSFIEIYLIFIEEPLDELKK
ncbi:MAG: hypothetical protein PHH84_04370 [Oscillospiraceae bacterium]|nr:hypothetical protein [Oscillospiraceae bacterium]